MWVLIAISFNINNMHVQVRKGKQNKTVRFQQVLSVPDFSCDDFLAINPSDAYLNSIDNGQSGHFTLDKYDNNMSCFIDITEISIYFYHKLYRSQY